MPDLRTVATEARRDFASGRIDRPLLRRLYTEYVADVPEARVEDIDEFLRAARHLFPDGNCGLTSAYLQHVLGRGIIVNGSYRTSGRSCFHTFLQIGDTVIDITADQFGGPAIYVGPLTPPWSSVWEAPVRR